MRSRGIDGGAIAACIKRGDLYESANGRNCVFVGRDKSGVPRFACMRGAFGDFKQDAIGSDKRYGFVIPAGTPDSRGVCVTEAPVDALSAATLIKTKSEPWEQYNYLSLGGTSPLAVIQFLKDHTEINHVFYNLIT